MALPHQMLLTAPLAPTYLFIGIYLNVFLRVDCPPPLTISPLARTKVLFIFEGKKDAKQ